MDQFRRGELVFDVIDAGPADGPVVVLLHGFPEQNTMWQPDIGGPFPCGTATRPMRGPRTI